MTKVQNLAPYPIDLPTGSIEPAQTGEVESTDSVAGLLAAGLLVEVEESEPSDPDPHKHHKAGKK